MIDEIDTQFSGTYIPPDPVPCTHDWLFSRECKKKISTQEYEEGHHDGKFHQGAYENWYTIMGRRYVCSKCNEVREVY